MSSETDADCAEAAQASAERDPAAQASAERDPAAQASAERDPASELASADEERASSAAQVVFEGEREPGPAGETAEAEQARAWRSEADHEAKLEHDLEELAAKAEKADEYLELAQRTKADFENYRKRAAREAAAAQERGVVKLALQLLPAVDNLDRALAATDGSEQSDMLVSGIKLVHKDVIEALARMGIEPYSPQGEHFDPQHHEAVAQQPVDGAEKGTIVEVYQRGYRLGDSVLRPARVVVAA